MPISCHFLDSKLLLITNQIHVSSTITSVQTFFFYILLSFLVVFFYVYTCMLNRLDKN